MKDPSPEWWICPDLWKIQWQRTAESWAQTEVLMGGTGSVGNGRYDEFKESLVGPYYEPNKPQDADQDIFGYREGMHAFGVVGGNL